MNCKLLRSACINVAETVIAREMSRRWIIAAGVVAVGGLCALLLQAEKQTVARQREQMEERQADYYWRRTTRRQAKAPAFLQMPPVVVTNESAPYSALSEVLRNKAATGTNHLPLTEMLSLKQVMTAAEPELVTFDLPIAYDVLTNLGSLYLIIDFTGREDEDSDLGFEVGQFECERAANGNCRLVWNTIYEAPGSHALQAGLLLARASGKDSYEEISGPVTSLAITNLCQFSLESAYFKPEFGVTLHRWHGGLGLSPVSSKRIHRRDAVVPRASLRHLSLCTPLPLRSTSYRR